MTENTKIPWTDHTWNPWQGCHKVSPGCDNCYMEREKLRYGQESGVVVRSAKATFNKPLTWKDPARVFTCSWSDFFIEEADEWRGAALDIIRQTPHLTYQILTKRPERIAECLPPDWGQGWKNVCLGVTVESSEYLWRVEKLLETPAAVRFVSVEPMLEGIDLGRHLHRTTRYHFSLSVDGAIRNRAFNCLNDDSGREMTPAEAEAELRSLQKRGIERIPSSGCDAFDDKTGCKGHPNPAIDWIIAGAESGPKRRPFDLDWARSLRDQCQAAGTPYFFKQGHDENGKVIHMPELDGVVHAEFPEARV